MATSKRQKIEIDVKSDGNISCDSSNNKGIETWREAAMNNKERNQYALKEGILSDVTFAVGPEKTLFHCHKTILSLASPVFEAMFFGALKETNQVIEITDLMPTGFKFLLDYIYSDDMKLKNEADAFAAWIAGDKYCLPYMKDICFKFLSELTITESNVWVILENALFLNSEALEEKCWNFLCKNISTAMENASFLDVSQDVVKKLVSMESLTIKESKLLLSIVKWVEEQIKNGSEGSMQELLQPFLGYIRFGCMSQDDFVCFIDEHKGVIPDSDAIAIMKFMTDDTSFSLPEWCCKNVNSRRVGSKITFGKKAIAAYALKPKRSDHAKRNHSPEAAPCSHNYHHPDDPIFHDYRTFHEESRFQYEDVSSTDSDNNVAMDYTDSSSSTSSSTDSESPCDSDTCG